MNLRKQAQTRQRVRAGHRLRMLSWITILKSAKWEYSKPEPVAPPLNVSVTVKDFYNTWAAYARAAVPKLVVEDPKAVLDKIIYNLGRREYRAYRRKKLRIFTGVVPRQLQEVMQPADDGRATFDVTFDYQAPALVE